MNDLLLFLGGLIALVLGAESLVRGASKLALSFGISPLVVGLTVVAFGTSAPETTVSVSAVLSGQTDIAVGNVVGSNILNVLFILGLAALIVPLRVDAQVIRQEVPMMMAASALLFVFVLDQQVSLFESAMLFTLLIAYTVFLIVQSRRQSAMVQAEYASEIKPAAEAAWDSKLPVQAALVVVGLALLILGSRWLVTAATGFARELGISELVIGLTVVAAGTSLPEVAASVSAALKGERDIAVGNVIGSNLFNILGCVGAAGIASGFSGLAIVPSVVSFDIWVMLAAAFACLPIFVSGREIERWEGGLFLLYYLAYVAYLVLEAQQHDQLQAYSSVMLSFVIPITIVTLVVSMIRRPATPS
ncbi:MAG: calcium/sodium antiporter [Steroidobacteraceae bacterium]